MTIKLLSSTFAILVLSVIAGAQTAPSGKTVILQVQAAVLGTHEGHQVFNSLESKFAARKAGLEKKQNEIAAMQEQFRKGSSTMSEEAQRKTARDIERKSKALNYEVETTQADYDQEQADATQAIEKKFRTVVDKYARDNGFGLVVDVSNPQSAAFWWAGALDITNEVVRAYDATYPVTATHESPAGKQEEY